MRIDMDFGTVQLEAELFDTSTGRALYARLPMSIDLSCWGSEAYGRIEGAPINTGNTVPAIPPGGLAYTDEGNYLCIFYGQRPAWPVEHVGRISGDTWQQLHARKPSKVTITPAALKSEAH